MKHHDTKKSALEEDRIDLPTPISPLLCLLGCLTRGLSTLLLCVVPAPLPKDQQAPKEMNPKVIVAHLWHWT